MRGEYRVHMSHQNEANRALPVFFGTEMWERYGFYAVQSLLALYLSLQLHLGDAKVYVLVGSFTALTYISPVIGGWIADKYLGQKMSVFVGGIVLFFSYILLGLSFSLEHLILSLASIAIGTGLLKPNISSLLGRQYAIKDPKRNSAFTIFYLGITTGIILGTTLPGKLQALFGWQACFFSAALGMVFAVFIFFMGTKVLSIKEYAVLKYTGLVRWMMAIGMLLLSYLVFCSVLLHPYMATLFFIAVATLATGVVLTIAYKEEGDQRKKTLSLLLLFIISTFFWSFYFEMFMMLTLFISRSVNPIVLGIHFPAPYYVSVQSVGMIVFGIFLSKLWVRLRENNVAYAIGLKFTLAIFFMFLAYVIILASCSNYQSTALISPWPILVAYVTISLAELMLSPIGLAAVTRLSSSNVVSTLMGVFFVSLGIGGFLSGQLAKVTTIQLSSETLVQIKTQYFHGFFILTLLLAVVLAVTALLCWCIKKLGKQILW